LQTFALGIVSETVGLDLQELIAITGSQNRVIVLNEGFVGLDRKLARILGYNVCTARSCRN